MSKKTKILVCGSAEFLMSNFIRYILYRSQDFKIVSVDNLEKPSDIKRIYFHRNHRFYVGDASDSYFMDRIFYIERPNVLICGDELLNYDKLLKTVQNIIRFNIPIIMVSPSVYCGRGNDEHGIYNAVDKIITGNRGVVVKLPNRFGMRQRPSMVEKQGLNLAYIMGCILNKMHFKVNNIELPWVYAEDVSSFLWYIVENFKKGETFYMPPLGLKSGKDIVEKIIQMYKLDSVSYKIEEIPGANQENETYHMVGWIPDSQHIEDALEKTIRWFDVNRWAFNE